MTSRFFLNQLNPQKRLGLSADKQRDIEERSKLTDITDAKVKRNNKKPKKGVERSAMARKSNNDADMMVVESGNSAHMTLLLEMVI